MDPVYGGGIHKDIVSQLVDWDCDDQITKQWNQRNHHCSDQGNHGLYGREYPLDQLIVPFLVVKKNECGVGQSDADTGIKTQVISIESAQSYAYPTAY